MIIVGAGEIAEPLPDLIAKYPNDLLVLQLRRRLPAEARTCPEQRRRQRDQLRRRLRDRPDDEGEGWRPAVIIGCYDLDFEKQAFMAFELGLKAVDPVVHVDLRRDRLRSTTSPHATAAFNSLDNGVDAVYPYLGGAHRAGRASWPTRTTSSR